MTNLEISSQDSLLAETNPASVDELFNRDPLLLQEKDLQVMCEYYRAKRENWIVEERQGKTKASSTKPKTLKGPKETGTLDDLKDLIL
jgi:hypothetical protein